MIGLCLLVYYCNRGFGCLVGLVIFFWLVGLGCSCLCVGMASYFLIMIVLLVVVVLGCFLLVCFDFAVECFGLLLLNWFGLVVLIVGVTL